MRSKVEVTGFHKADARNVPEMMDGCHTVFKRSYIGAQTQYQIARTCAAKSQS